MGIFRTVLAAKDKNPTQMKLRIKKRKSQKRGKEGTVESEKQEGNNLEAQVAKKSRGGIAFRCSWIKSSSYVARMKPLHLSVLLPSAFASLLS